MSSLMSKEQFKAATGLSDTNVDKWYLPVLNGFTEYNVYSSLRMAHFIAQIMHETMSFKYLEENLNYRSTSRLVQVFKSRNGLTPVIASRLVGDPQAIANFVYGGTWGKNNLGNTEPSDGWDFRGSGAMHTTGRYNHEEVAKALGVDLHRSAELMRTDPEYAMRTASWYWMQRKVNVPADVDHLRRVTKLVNGGENGLDDRQKHLNKAKAALL